VTIAPFLVGQPVRIIKVPHEMLRIELGQVEIVSRVMDSGWVWTRPASSKPDGSVILHPHVHYEIAHRLDELEAVTCA
jgi:hypothetical protein